MKKWIYDRLDKRKSPLIALRRYCNFAKKESFVDRWNMEWLFADAWSMIVEVELR